MSLPSSNQEGAADNIHDEPCKGYFPYLNLFFLYLLLQQNLYLTLCSCCQATESLFRMAVMRGYIKPVKHGEVS